MYGSAHPPDILFLNERRTRKSYEQTVEQEFKLIRLSNFVFHIKIKSFVTFSLLSHKLKLRYDKITTYYSLTRTPGPANHESDQNMNTLV